MDGNLVNRKMEQLKICLENDVEFRKKTTGFEKYEFIHNALPEINLSDVDTCTQFLRRKIKFPFMISAMSGGFEEAERLNLMLVEAASELGIAMTVGSQRQFIESGEFGESCRAIREKASGIPVVGNIGAAQLSLGIELKQMEKALSMISADAISVHLNPIQEVIQPEGQPFFRNVLREINRLVKQLEIPVIVKETGGGISAEVAQRLVDAGVAYIDVAGAGGTSWAGVEFYRIKGKGSSREIAKKFWDWGIPTAECIKEVASIPGARIIASGGIKDGIDIAKSIALGASLSASARAVIRSLMKDGVEQLIKMLNQWKRELQIVMFLTGSRKVEDLRSGQKIRKMGDGR
ncbi:MAG: type 2 isopentenyl-diphosphate Delta-isomerase [Fidelibacterota bacterium]